MTLMKVIGNEETSLKIMSAKAETTEIKLRTVSIPRNGSNKSYRE